mgnify:FL=1
MTIEGLTIGGILGLIGGIGAIIKKKPHALWYRSLIGDPPGWKWAKKAGPMSARQCRKTMNALLKTGQYEADRFAIFRAGVDPNV